MAPLRPISARGPRPGCFGPCRRREHDAVVVVRLDRLARSLAHMARLGEELRALGVELLWGLTTTVLRGNRAR